ncbi:hypothetical protein SADUNF_Sadunf04G0088500 [Salix dunnii]|uniref:Uncharacterized protein n=1 Tax=Salix dunnii TaxID=1413687 RepID=A0A835MZ29_9ROSI|nr:hypothetical protein SADUNF_Sadunf04G0088500 [Salix dunnii]
MLLMLHMYLLRIAYENLAMTTTPSLGMSNFQDVFIVEIDALRDSIDSTRQISGIYESST